MRLALSVAAVGDVQSQCHCHHRHEIPPKASGRFSFFLPFIFRTSSIYSYFSLSLFSRHDHNNYDQVVSLLEGADEVKQLKKESLMLYQSTCRLICSGHCGTLQNFAPFTFCYLNTDFELKLIYNLVNYCCVIKSQEMQI